jgi:hypothetical protein
LARLLLGTILALPVGWFAVAGVHDYFRWNDARWSQVGVARSLGVSAENLDGGYEVNGWLNYDNYLRGSQPGACIGVCRCPPESAYCSDASYSITLGAPSGREALDTRPVDYWLAAGPPVVLSRRQR